MDDRDKLLIEIDRFLAKTGMAETTFGQKAVRNWRIVEQLKHGSNVGINTIARLREFMRSYGSVAA